MIMPDISRQAFIVDILILKYDILTRLTKMTKGLDTILPTAYRHTSQVKVNPCNFLSLTSIIWE